MLQFYLVFCVLGTVLAFSQLVPFLLGQGLNPQIFVEQLFDNHVSALFGWDVIVAELVLWGFIFWEGSRLGMKHLWICIAGSLVGVSTGLPLFLFMRQRHLEKSSHDL